MSPFIPGYPDIVTPLRELTHKDVEFKWEEVHQTALEKLKHGLSSNEVVANFCPTNKSVPIVDASPVGLGAMLIQDGKVISYGSKALSSVERRYSQIEREALAITWGLSPLPHVPPGKSFHSCNRSQGSAVDFQQPYLKGLSKDGELASQKNSLSTSKWCTQEVIRTLLTTYQDIFNVREM